MAVTRSLRGCRILAPGPNSDQNLSNDAYNESQERSCHSHGSPENAGEETNIRDPGEDVYINIEISDEQGNIQVRRGPTRATEIWTLPEGHKIKVDCNDLAQPVDKAAGVLSSWLGTVARSGSWCPLHYDDWRKLVKDYGTDLLDLVKGKFVFPPNQNVDGWLYDSLNHKWRAYKHKLKNKYMLKDVDRLSSRELEEKKRQVTLNVPSHVKAEQWNVLVEYWFSPKSKKRAHAGRLARGIALEQETNLHTTGSMSYARKKHQFEKENGRQPRPLEIYKITHKKKSNNDDQDGDIIYANPKSREKVEEAERLVNQRLSNEPESSIETIEGEVFKEIFGMHKWGTPKGFGLGVRSSHCSNGKVLIGNSRAPNAEVMRLNSEVEHMKKDLAQMENMKDEIKELKAHNQAVLAVLVQNMGAASASHTSPRNLPTSLGNLQDMYARQPQDDMYRNLLLPLARPNAPQINNPDDGFRNMLGVLGQSSAYQVNNHEWRNIMQLLGQPLSGPPANYQVGDLSNRPLPNDQNARLPSTGSFF